MAEAGLEGLPGDVTIDTVDAACAALTAGRYLDGAGSWLGDPREGVLVLPVASLRDAYHRCAPPEAGGAAGVHEARPAAEPRLCECGCGTPVRKRFVPGHAARLRGRLLAEARAGAAARAELERLGWLRFLEEDG
jgi:hypothetical protein